MIEIGCPWCGGPAAIEPVEAAVARPAGSEATFRCVACAIEVVVVDGGPVAQAPTAALAA